MKNVWAGISFVVTLVLSGCAATPGQDAEAGSPPTVAEADSVAEASGSSESDSPAESDLSGSGDFTESGFPTSQTATLTSQFPSIAPSVVKVGDDFSYGTGWVFDANHVVTNWHVIDFMADPIVMETYDGRLLYGTVIASEEFDDIAVVRLQEPTSLTPLTLAASPAEEGDPVFFIGHPSSIGDWIIGAGVVSSFDEFFAEFVRSTLPADPGASGSAMLNLQGEVVALISGCMGSVIGDRPKGDGSVVFSAQPNPPVTDNCGGTNIESVKQFVDTAIARG